MVLLLNLLSADNQCLKGKALQQHVPIQNEHNSIRIIDPNSEVNKLDLVKYCHHSISVTYKTLVRVNF